MNMPVNIADGLESITASLGTARDKASSVVYAETYINDEELTAAYKTSWLARKIIDVPATDTFRRWRNWQAEEDQIEKLEDLEKKLGLKEKFTRAKKLARLYGCCYVYYDLGDDQMQPVDLSKVKASGIRFVTVLTHRQLSPGEIEQDALSDQFGKPKWFDVVSTTSGNVRIDPSRVIVFLGSESPDDNLLVGTREGHGSRLGTSVLLATLPAVKHFDSVATNIASLVFEAKIDVIKVKGLMQIAGNPYEEAKLLARYALAAVAKGNNGMLILDGEMEEYEQKSYSFAALPDIMDRFSQNASGAADVPMTRLFGNSPGGLNSTGEGDLRHYYDHLSSIQELQITPALEMFDECLIRAALGSRPPEVYYLWASLWQMSDKERSDLGSTGVNTIKTLKDTGLIPDEVLSRGAVNMLTQAGVIPGLEAEYAAYFDGGGEAPWDIEADAEAEAAAAKVQPKKPQPGKPGALTDEQPRDPKGTSTGGQWSSGGGADYIGQDNIKGVSYSELKTQVEGDPPPITSVHKRTYDLLDAPDISHNVFGAVQHYTQEGYLYINDDLRSGRPVKDKAISILDSAISESKVVQPFTLVRGISERGLGDMTKDSDIKVGSVLKDKAFISTTRDVGTALSFSTDEENSQLGYVMKIKVPAGLNVLYAGDSSFNDGEDEFILPRGSTFKVTAIKGNVITAELGAPVQ